MSKVALVTNMIAPYRVSFYNALANRVDLCVIADTYAEFDRKWKVDASSFKFTLLIQKCFSFVYRRTRSDVGYKEKRQFHFSEKTYSHLKACEPDVVIAIEFGLKALWCIGYSLLHGRPLILISEGSLHTEGHVGRLKKLLRKFIVSQCDRFWSNGPASTELLLSYGADATLIDEGMTGIDTRELAEHVKSALVERYKTRRNLGIEGCALLYSGALSQRKGVMIMLQAVTNWMRLNKQPFTLIILGDGECKEQIMEWQLIHSHVPLLLPGFVQPEDLGKWYAVADRVIIPTLDDNWPLATLEALVSGLPQLFSCYNGATMDLANEFTGIQFDPLDEDSFVDGLSKLVDDFSDRIPDSICEKFSVYYSAEQQAERAFVSINRLIS
jgi:glycosyltransferase involved in cell wall biosynthesis